MAEPGSLLHDAELEGAHVIVEIDPYDILCCNRSLALHPEAVPPRVINSFS